MKAGMERSGRYSAQGLAGRGSVGSQAMWAALLEVNYRGADQGSSG